MCEVTGDAGPVHLLPGQGSGEHPVPKLAGKGRGDKQAGRRKRSRRDSGGEKIVLRESPRYIKELCGWKVSHKTVYNWVRHGHKGVNLDVIPDGLPASKRRRQYTTLVFLRQFLRDIGAITGRED